MGLSFDKISAGVLFWAVWGPQSQHTIVGVLKLKCKNSAAILSRLAREKGSNWEISDG